MEHPDTPAAGVPAGRANPIADLHAGTVGPPPPRDKETLPERYALLLENVADVAVWGTNDGVIESVAPSVERVLGWTPPQLEGTRFADLVHPDDVARVRDVQQGLLHGVPGSIEVRLRTAGDGWRWMAINVDPVLDETGAVVGRVALGRDVHEAVEARRALAASEARLRALTETMPSGMVVHAPDGSIVEANPAAEALLGLTRDQLVGRVSVDPRWRAVRPDGTDLPGELHPAMLTLATRERQRAVMGVERPDGTQVWLSVVSVPLDAELQHDCSVLAMFTDVTAAVEAERRLAESEERYRAMVEDVGDVLVRSDADGVLTYVSNAVETVLGWSPQEMTGTRMRELVHPEDAPAVGRAARDLTSQSTSIEARLRCKDGGYRWIQSIGRWLEDDAGNRVGGVAVWRDVTRRVESEAALRESEERYRLVAANATDVVFRARIDGSIEWVSESVERVLGLPADQVIGSSGFGGVHPEDLEVAARGLQQAITGDQPRMRLRVSAADGRWRWVSNRMSPVRDDDGAVVGLVGGWTDVTDEVEDELALAAERARLRAVLDSLMDPHVLVAAVRDESGQLVDLTYVAANERARAALPGQPEDVAGRLVGRTLATVAGERTLDQVFTWCREALDRGEPVALDSLPLVWEPQELQWIDVRAVPVGDLVSLTWRDVSERVRAQQRLQDSAASTRHLLDAFDPALAHVEADPEFLYDAVRATLDTDGLDIVVQPIVDMRQPSIVKGYEALSRFPESRLGGPAAWFAAANRAGLGVPLEMLALRRALDVLPRLEAGATLSVNVSPLTVTTGLRDLRNEPIPWHRLILELTEHVPVEDYALVNECLAPLRRQGVLVAIDDTGAGFASLRHVLDLHPDVIKLDVGLVRGIDGDLQRAGVARMLVDFSSDVGATVIAEGVETPAERDKLLELGAVWGQGYLFGRPEPPPAMRAADT